MFQSSGGVITTRILIFFTGHELNRTNSSEKIPMAEAGYVTIAEECVPVVNTKENLRAGVGGRGWGRGRTKLSQCCKAKHCRYSGGDLQNQTALQ